MTKLPQDNSADDTTAETGIEKTLSDELIKGLRCAAQSHTALDQQERLTLLAEAENAYQNVLCLVMKAGKRARSPIAKKLRQLRKFINEKQHTSKRK